MKPLPYIPQRKARQEITPRRKVGEKASPSANFLGRGPVQWKNNRLRMMIRIPPL